MNLIQAEAKAAKSKMLKLIPGTELVDLTRDNVAIVEAMIATDSAYRKATDKNAGPAGKYGGSGTFWYDQLRKYTIGHEQCDFVYEDIIMGIVSAVDRENSTHLNSDGVGRNQITDRIISFGQDRLMENLMKPEECNYELYYEIARKTEPAEPKYHARENISFASKFCHFACLNLFEGEEEQDNFSIYDSALVNAIPLYFDYYKLPERNLRDYPKYQAAIMDIILKGTERISRNGFDQLIWYYYKSRI